MGDLLIINRNEIQSIVDEALNNAIMKTSLPTLDKKEIPELLSIEVASKYLNLAKQTLYGFTSKGVIPHLKKGKKLYFKKTELDKWINEGKKI